MEESKGGMEKRNGRGLRGTEEEKGVTPKRKQARVATPQ